MATVWTLEITGGEDVPPGLWTVCTSRRKVLEAARAWAHLPKGSRAIRWEHRDDGSAFGVLSDDSQPDEGEAYGEPYFLHVRRWVAR